MNAVKFIKLYGLHSARVTVEDAQENTHYCTEAGYHSTKLDVAYEPCPDCVSIPDLKRLVESVDLINANGRLNGTKNTITLFQSSLDLGLYHGVDGVDVEVEIPRLKQAIADYESVYGGEHV